MIPKVDTGFRKISCSSKKLDFDPIRSNRIKVYGTVPHHTLQYRMTALQYHQG
jgi:hypothetical protein